MTGIAYYPEHMVEHLCHDARYSDTPDRLEAAYSRLEEAQLLSRMRPVELSKHEERDDLLHLAHSDAYINYMRSSSSEDHLKISEMTMKFDSVDFTSSSFGVACKNLQITTRMARDVCTEKLLNAFALIRPPSHHSEYFMGANGYCLVNTAAITIKQMQREHLAEKVLILDWDVHHGQGTQNQFYEDDTVLYISIHRFDGFFPYLPEGDIGYAGFGKGEGFNINIPWTETGMCDEEYIAAVLQVVLPVGYEFNPDLVVVLAGFDSAEGDPKGQMNVSPECFAHIVHHMSGLARGKVLMLLEGGYNPEVVADCVECCVSVLLGDPLPALHLSRELQSSAVEQILKVIAVQSRFWSCFQFQQSSVGVAEQRHKCLPELMISPSDKKLEAPGKQPRHEKTKLVGYAYNEAMLKHRNDIDPSHPECPERISAIHKHLLGAGLLCADVCCVTDGQDRISPEYLCSANPVHSQDYLLKQEDYMKCCKPAKLMADYHDHNRQSIFCNEHTWEAAQLSASCLLAVLEDVFTDRVTSAFANIRPPGHHAEVNRAFGFCFMNNVAIAAEYARRQFPSLVKRVLILDWDVHHGNGTQHQYENDPNVLYISIHRHGMFFPGGTDGGADHTGTGTGKGFNVNIAWLSSGAGDLEYIAAFTNVVLPIVYEFCPDLVIVSCGFDSAVHDPLGGQRVSPACFAHMTHMLKAFASGRMILALEGGYNLKTISLCAEEVMRALQDNRLPELKLPSSMKPTFRDSIISSIAHHTSHWKQLRFLQQLPADVEPVIQPPYYEGPPDETHPRDLPEESERDSLESIYILRRYWRRRAQED